MISFSSKRLIINNSYQLAIYRLDNKSRISPNKVSSLVGAGGGAGASASALRALFIAFTIMNITNATIKKLIIVLIK